MRPGRGYDVVDGGRAPSSSDRGPAGAADLSPLLVAVGPAATCSSSITSAGAGRPDPQDGDAARDCRHPDGGAGDNFTVAGNGGSVAASAAPATGTGMTPHGVAFDTAGNLVRATDYQIRGSRRP